MKTILKTLMIFSLILITSCSDDELILNEMITVNDELAIKDIDKESISNRRPVEYPIKYSLTYLGDNQWRGYWANVELTFSGCTPESLTNNYCLFNAINAESGGLLSFEGDGINEGSVTIATMTTTTFTFNSYNKSLNSENEVVYNWEDVEYTSYTIGATTIPYKIIFVANTPILVHPDYSSTDLPVAPE